MLDALRVYHQVSNPDIARTVHAMYSFPRRRTPAPDPSYYAARQTSIPRDTYRSGARAA
jgi:hypothetical protein